jgi:hypothetical protein
VSCFFPALFCPDALILVSKGGENMKSLSRRDNHIVSFDTAFCIFLSKIVEVNSTPEIKRAEIEYFENFTLLHEYLFRSQS